MADTGCTADWIKSENRKVIDGFQGVGEQIILIDDDYRKVISEITCSLNKNKDGNNHFGLLTRKL